MQVQGVLVGKLGLCLHGIRHPAEPEVPKGQVRSTPQRRSSNSAEVLTHHRRTYDGSSHAADDAMDVGELPDVKEEASAQGGGAAGTPTTADGGHNNSTPKPKSDLVVSRLSQQMFSPVMPPLPMNFLPRDGVVLTMVYTILSFPHASDEWS